MKLHLTKSILSVTILTLLFINQSHGQGNTSESQTPVKMSDLAWLSGYWIGDGFGGVSEEFWGQPSAGSIVGTYKHFKDGKVTFYEFLSMAEYDGKFSLRLKHFNQDITGWEEKEEFVEFPLVAVSKNKIEFKGLVYELVSEGEMEVRLKLKQGDKVSTEVFHFNKKKI